MRPLGINEPTGSPSEPGRRRGRRSATMRRNRWTDDTVMERAEFAERTVKDLCALLRTEAGYADLAERIERAQGALQSIRITLWQRELVRTTGGPRRAA